MVVYRLGQVVWNSHGGSLHEPVMHQLVRMVKLVIPETMPPSLTAGAGRREPAFTGVHGRSKRAAAILCYRTLFRSGARCDSFLP